MVIKGKIGFSRRVVGRTPAGELRVELVHHKHCGRQLRAERRGARHKDQNPLPAITAGHVLNTTKDSPKKQEDWMYKKATVCRSVHVTANRIYFY